MAARRVVLEVFGRPLRCFDRSARRAESRTGRSGAGWMTVSAARSRVPAARSTLTEYEPAATAAASTRPPA